MDNSFFKKRIKKNNGKRAENALRKMLFLTF